MRRLKRHLGAVLLLAGFLVGPPGGSAVRAADGEQFAPAAIEFFEKRIRPLLIQRCFACHSSSAKQLQGGLRLDRRAGLLAGGDSGPAIVPGKADASLLIEAVRYGNDDVQMPPQGKLLEDEIAALVKWIEMGAPTPADSDVASPVKPSIDFDAGRKFWSFQPLSTRPLPDMVTTGWAENRIDCFVLNALEQRGLHPSPAADRRTLIRRATFDLIGLPPTPEQVAAFENDTAGDAYQRLVDRLLAAPQFGERWGRYWLDRARYSDTTASWLQSAGQAYLYRDWVVAQCNADLAYDEFVKRQLATDLMPETGPADIAALGFLGLSPTYWKELKLDKDVIKTVVAEEWEERIDAVGRTFLGLTIACARCHDHKFDPISSEDYYALAGVFASTRLTDRPIIDDARFQVAEAARQKVAALAAQQKKLKDQQPPPEDLASRLAELDSQIQHIEDDTPCFDSPLANAVDEASLYVLAAGTDGTRLEYKPGQPRDVAIHTRGNPANPGKVVPRRFLTVFSPAKTPFQTGSGRLELAESIVGDAAPLAARVIVNRVWLQHFGRGLVDTPSNFGQQGGRPSHPELLDDLAARFILHKWSLKWLHREIMLSATYRQANLHDGSNDAVDPANRWLWRMNRRRLEIEAWRDSILTVAGTLDPRIGGPAIDLNEQGNQRRTLYGAIHRRELNDMLRMYDFPDPNAHSPAREITITPLQQLFALNSDFVQHQSAVLATRLNQASPGDRDEFVRLAYQTLFQRNPTPTDRQLAREFLHSTPTGQTHDELLRQYVQALLTSNEFLFVD